MHEQTVLNERMKDLSPPLSPGIFPSETAPIAPLLENKEEKRTSREQGEEVASNNLQFLEIVPGLWVPRSWPGLLSPEKFTKEG